MIPDGRLLEKGEECDSPLIEKEKDVGLGNYLVYAEGPFGTV